MISNACMIFFFLNHVKVKYAINGMNSLLFIHIDRKQNEPAKFRSLRAWTKAITMRHLQHFSVVLYIEKMKLIRWNGRFTDVPSLPHVPKWPKHVVFKH